MEMEQDRLVKDPAQAGEWEVAYLPDKVSAEWEPVAARDADEEEVSEWTVAKVAVVAVACAAGRNRQAT
ncbi:MAG: hypothetical protein JW808_01410 [Victivallales bacterium]|nr:hypothetical protein [Victivallales bacterium]